MKVVIAHRNAATGHGLALLLAKYGDFNVVAEVSDASMIVDSVTANSPDLLLVDSEFPNIDLDDTIREVKQVGGEIAVAVIAGSEDWSLLDSSMRAGATSFISMKTDPEQLALSLRLAGDGHVLVSTPLVASLSDLFRSDEGLGKEGDSQQGHDLSQRELEILQLVAQGSTNAEIAEELVIAENTVKVHMRNILGKLQLRNRQQAAAYALQSGIVRDLTLPSFNVS